MSTCVLCVTPFTEKALAAHYAEKHIEGMRLFVLQRWNRTCPVCDSYIIHPANQRTHIENHAKPELIITALEFIGSAPKPLADRPIVPHGPKKSALDDFFWRY